MEDVRALLLTDVVDSTKLSEEGSQRGIDAAIQWAQERFKGLS
jgi:hypothetical protein